jgi:hypothetical protein
MGGLLAAHFFGTLRIRWAAGCSATNFDEETWLMTMTEAQFDAIVKLMRGTPESGANRAARRVLVDGFSQAEAMREHDTTRATVSNAVRRYQEADDLIRSAYCPKPRQTFSKPSVIAHRDLDPETLARNSGPLTSATIVKQTMPNSNQINEKEEN